MHFPRGNENYPGSSRAFPGGASGKEPPCQCRRCRRPGFNPWVGKIPWRRKWQSTPVFFLENPMDRGAWRATVHGVTQSQTRLSDYHHYDYLVGQGAVHCSACHRCPASSPVIEKEPVCVSPTTLHHLLAFCFGHHRLLVSRLISR